MRASSLSDAKVISLLNHYFVPVYVSNEDLRGNGCAPPEIRKEVQRIYRVSVIGRLESVFEEFYAISAERKIKHPAVVAITETARNQLFAA